MKRLELWMGRAGSLKSRTIASEIAAEVRERPIGDKIYWIVPETASFAAEQILMESTSTTIRAEVVTLSRFAQRLEHEARLGAGEAINRTGQRLLLAHVLKESSHVLDMLHRARPTLGFLDSILDTFDEMSSHLVSMDGLQAALQIASAKALETSSAPAANAGRRLLGKLHDLCALYFLYQREMAARGLTDPSDRVVGLLPHLSRLPSLRGSRIYLDGFQSLKPREFEFFMGLAEVACEVVVSVSADPEWFRTTHLGAGVDAPDASESKHRKASTWELVAPSPWSSPLQALLEDTPDSETVYGPNQLRFITALMDACKQRDWQCSVRSFAVEGGDKHPELSYLESQLIGLSRTAFVEEGVGTAKHHDGGRGISLFAAQNIRAEASGVAEDILRRVEQGQARYRDVVVVVPDVEAYAPYLKESFRQNGVPLDSSDSPSLATHPLGKFLLTSLAIVEERLSTASAIRLLKTEFTSLSREDADWFEGYLTRHGVSGFSDWQGPFEFSTQRSERGQEDKTAVYEDKRANLLRERLEPICVTFYRAVLAPEITPLEFAEGIWQLLDSLRVKRAVASWVVDESSAQDPHLASQHEQAWQHVISILGDLAETMPDRPLPSRFLFQSVREDILSQELAAVPAGLDTVLVLDVERAAAVHRKVSYVMGVVDGALPRRIRTTGLLQDDEREQFLRLFGTRIGETAEDRQLAERYTVYTALTRGDDALILSYPMANKDGKELQPSSVLSVVEALFRGHITHGWWPEGGGEHVVWTPRTALLHVVSSLRDAYLGIPAPPGTASLYRALLASKEAKERLYGSFGGIVHKARALPISVELAQKLYGTPMHVNVYQLETAASCAYRHFLQYGLQLNEAESADLTKAERGTLIHAALALFVSEQERDIETWRGMTDQEAETAMEKIFTALLERPVNQIWTKTATRRAQAYEAQTVAKRTAIVLKRHLEHSRFTPYQLELAFGTADEGALPPYRFELLDGTVVEVRGRLDRLDVAEEDGERRFRIIDYKSRVMDIDLAKVFHGIRLQLAVYSTVVKTHAPLIWGGSASAAGFFYLPLVRKIETANRPIGENEAFEKAISRMKARGLWRGDDVSVRWMDERLVSLGESELFPKMYKKDGTFTKTAPVLSPVEWDAMEEAVIGRVRESTEQIHMGDISIQPYAFNRQDTACATCSFSSVCQIDRRWDVSPFRWLQKPSKAEVLANWMTGEDGV